MNDKNPAKLELTITLLDGDGNIIAVAKGSNEGVNDMLTVNLGAKSKHDSTFIGLDVAKDEETEGEPDHD